MNTSYPTRPLADIADRIDYGLTASAVKDRDAGPRFLRITDIVPAQLDWESVPFCALTSEGDRAKFALLVGDIVIARTGATVGYSKFIATDVDAVFASYLVRVRVNSEWDARYVSYVVGSEDYKEFIRANAGGAAQPNANARVLTSYEVPLPTLGVQRKIAAVLSAYDDLIENNNRRIKLLEEMAQRIYREWFVDFRYPGHETIPLVDSELGPIPRGWSVKGLGELALVEKGLSYKGEFLTDDGLPMANLKCFDASGGFRRDGTKPYSGPYKQKHVIGPGSLIMANTDLTQNGKVIGSPAIVPRRGFSNGGLFTHHLFAIRPRDVAPSISYFYYALDDSRFRDFARSRASGTTVLGLRTSDCESYRVIVPEVEVEGRFSAMVKDVLLQAEVLQDCNESMRVARDFLLPRLISGEIDLSNLDIALPEGAT